MVLGRVSLGLLCAIAVGWVVGNRRSELTGDPDDTHEDHQHGPRHASFFGHLAGDFVFMGRYLVLGAAVAAAMQTFIPQSIMGSIAGTPVIDLLAMMGLAFLLSLCSESDAFVAASFVQFGVGAQLAFLVFGPLLDTKLTFLYSGTFGARLLRTIAVVVGAVTLAGTLWLEVLFG
ncbi:MAG: permease [Actinomycetota bacterium]